MQYSNSKKPANQLRGAINRNTGQAFEDLIEASCDLYRIRKLANVKKTPEPFRPVSGVHQKGRLWIFDCVAAKKAQPDFKGTLRGGRSVCFEAKTADDDRIKQDAVTQEQDEDLTLHQELGALAYVFVSLKLRDFYRVPWPIWKNMKEHFGRKYMTAEDLSPYRIKFDSGVLKLFDEVT